jgi:hypothetical protein
MQRDQHGGVESVAVQVLEDEREAGLARVRLVSSPAPAHAGGESQNDR